MNRIASALAPIRAIAWGEEAMGHLGVGTILNVSRRKLPDGIDTNISQAHMVVIEDADLEAAIESLHKAGLSRCPLVLRLHPRSTSLSREVHARLTSGYGPRIPHSRREFDPLYFPN